MERVLHRNDLVLALFVPPQTREFHQPFVCFGSGIAEEAFSMERNTGQPFRQFRLVLVEEHIRHVDQRSRLVSDGLNHMRVTMSDIAHRNARHKIKVHFPIGVPYLRPFPLDQDKALGIGLHHILVVQCNNIFFLTHRSQSPCLHLYQSESPRAANEAFARL